MSDFARPIEAHTEAAQAPMRSRPSPPRARALSSAPAPALERPRPAPGASSRPAAPEPASADSDAKDRHADARAERLRVALRMLASGKTHGEIAAHFGRSIRAIRYWLLEARAMRIAVFRSESAEEVLADAEDEIRRLRSIAWEKLRAAIDAGEDRRADLWMRHISMLADRRLSLHERLGAFDVVRSANERRAASAGAETDINPSKLIRETQRAALSDLGQDALA